MPVLLRLALTLALTTTPWLLDLMVVETDFMSVSLGQLGLGPLTTAMVLVEIVAWAAPPLRWRRHGGPAARRPLWLAACVVALVIAVLMALQLAQVAGVGAAIFAVVGSALLVGAAKTIDDFGVGSGIALITLAPTAVAWLMPPIPGDLGEGLLETFTELATVQWLVVLATAAVTVVMLALTSRGRRALNVGTAPLGLLDAMAALALIGVMLATSSGELAFAPAHRPSVLVVVSLTTAGASLWFARGAAWAVRLRCALVSVLFVLALYGLDSLYRPYADTPAVAAFSPSVGSIALVTALVIDLVAELRARAREPLVVAWELADVDRADRVSARLRAAGVRHHISGHALRRLLRIIGPWARCRLLVAPAHLDAARQIAASEESRPLVEHAIAELA